MQALAWLAWRNLIGRPRHALQNGIGLILIMAMISALASLGLGTFDAIAQLPQSRETGHITLRARPRPPSSPHAHTLGASVWLERLRQDKRCKTVNAHLRAPGIALSGTRRANIRLFGGNWQPLGYPPAIQKATLQRGHWPTRPDEVALGKGLSKALQLGPNTPLRVVAIDGQGHVCDRSFSVSGVFESHHDSYDEHLVVMPLAGAQAFLHLPDRVDEIALTLANPATAPDVAQDLRQTFHGQVQVQAWQDTAKTLLDSLTQFRQLLILGLGLLMVSGAVSLGNTIIMGVGDRLAEIGTLRALGLRARAVATIFLLEGAILGMIASTLGTVLGLLSAHTTARLFATNPSLIPDLGPLIHAAYDPLTTIWVALGGVMISVTAYGLTARAAARFDPIQAISHGQ